MIFMARRKNAFVEKRLLNEWLRERFPTSPPFKQPRLGPTATVQEARLFKSLMRFPDAIVIEKGQVHIIEAKIVPDFGAIGQLEGYNKLFDSTPEFTDFHTTTRNLILLVGQDDVQVRAQAEEKGIEFVVFEPLWVKQAIIDRAGR